MAILKAKPLSPSNQNFLIGAVIWGFGVGFLSHAVGLWPALGIGLLVIWHRGP